MLCAEELGKNQFLCFFQELVASSSIFKANLQSSFSLSLSPLHGFFCDLPLPPSFRELVRHLGSTQITQDDLSTSLM